jgi:hypothetical protein
VSREIASRLRWPRVSFGDHVRTIVHARGLDATDRDICQDIGQELVDANAPAFCRAVLSQADSAWNAGGNLIIDGLRHVEVASVLRDLVYPSTLKVILIETDLATRVARMAGNASPNELARWAEHPTEIQIAVGIRGIADLTVDGSQSLEIVVGEILSWLQGISAPDFRDPRGGGA